MKSLLAVLLLISSGCLPQTMEQKIEEGKGKIFVCNNTDIQISYNYFHKHKWTKQSVINYGTCVEMIYLPPGHKATNVECE
jgi:hypothetical protein